MSFYGGNQNGGQPGSAQQQQLGRQPNNPGLQNVQQVLTPQLFNINVNPNQLHNNFFNEHNASQAPLQLNPAAAAAGTPSLLLQTQQSQTFPVNLINEQLGVGVSQLITPAGVSQNQMQGLPISMSSALNFPQTIQVHAATAASQSNQPQSQQSKQRVFTGTVTKIHDNFGFIDEEVFFQMGVVKGPILPKEGDRVLVEANFNTNMPFKWNASRVQIVNIGGGLSSMSNMNSNQNQHMGYNNQVGMQKQQFAPPPPVLSSQGNPGRPHAPQPVTIVSNPHSVYGGGNNPRGRVNAPPVSLPAPPPLHNQPHRGDPNKGNMGMSMSEPPPFINSGPGSSGMNSDRDRDMDRGRDRSRDRDNMRDRSKDRQRDRSRERDSFPRPRSRSRERVRDRSRERDKVHMPRSRTPDRKPGGNIRDRSRERKVRGSSREKSRERNIRDADRSRPRHEPSRMRSQSPRDISRDRHGREKSPEKIKRERSPEKFRDRITREQARDKEERKPSRKNSISPSSRNSKEDLKRDISKMKEKDNKQATEKSRGVRRDRSPPVLANTERSKRSRSRESVRTEKGHVPERERSRSRSTSPKRRVATRPSPRYAVELPKFPLDTKELSAKELQRRYPNLYVPSDFLLVRSTWMDTFPMHAPFELGKACPIQIMRKGVIKIEIPDPDSVAERFDNVPDMLEPVDASNTFKAKVMIPSLTSLDTLYRKACGIGEDDSHVSDSFQHVDRLISFVIGMKTAKHEVMAIGGPWSPSLDGTNPHSDPTTLINTAIRSVRALTGINLSRCKTWYRFMEVYYKRGSCLETVVFYLPDVWSCVPGTTQWGKIKSLYKQALHGESAVTQALDQGQKDEKAQDSTAVNNSVPTNETKHGSAAEGDSAAASSTEAGGNNSTSAAGEPFIDTKDSSTLDDGLLVIDEAASPTDIHDGDGASEEHRHNEDDSTMLVAGVPSESATNTGGVNPMEVLSTADKSVSLGAKSEGDEQTKAVPKSQEVATEIDSAEKEKVSNGTHFSLLSPTKMTVAQLKEELTLRSLSPKGLKQQLTQRLVAALKEEEAQELELQKSKIASEPVKSTAENIVIEKSSVEAMDTSSVEIEIAKEANKPHENEKIEKEVETEEPEQMIRLVNPSLLFEDVDDNDDVSAHEDDISADEGEIKEDTKNETPAVSAQTIFAKYPANTFPIVKTGMKEEEVKMWERRYALPKNPRILVYPSTSAKNGNFDCVAMTLGLLRDYRIIDKKEDTFEVSLFSELFHEMLQRDFAFRIYQEIVTESGKVNLEDGAVSEKDDKSDKDAGEPANKKIKLSDTNSVAQASQKKKTTDPFLLLSFVFFDVTRCGYIMETDLEDLCNCIGVGVTRAQVRKLVQKCIHKGSLHYRQWTDRTEKSKPRNEEELRILAKGSNSHFPVFVRNVEEKPKDRESEEDGESILVMVDGRNVDVKKLLSQLDNNEKHLAVADSDLNVMKNSLNEARTQVSDLKKSNESLKDELVKAKESLKKSEATEKSARDDLEVFKRASERYLDRVKDLVKFPVSSTKEKSEGTAKEPVKIKEKSNSTETKDKCKQNHESNQPDCEQGSSSNGNPTQSTI